MIIERVRAKSVAESDDAMCVCLAWFGILIRVDSFGARFAGLKIDAIVSDMSHMSKSHGGNCQSERFSCFGASAVE
jgi:hypothetical protein